MYDSRNSYHSSKHELEDKKIIDKDTELEAIAVIKSQSRKIKDLNDELEKKEEIIITLQTKMNNMENYKLQMENFKRQVSILEEKLRLYDNEVNSKNSYFSEQFKTITDSENKLRTQLINKDKLLRDYDIIIKDQEKTINLLKKQIVEKETVNKELKQEFNEISARFKNLNLKLSLREEDYKKLHNEYENKLGNLEEDKYKTEDKVNELIDIVKQQSRELSDFSVQTQIFDKEKKMLQKNIEKIKLDYEDSCKSNIELKQQLNMINELKKQINDTDQVTSNLQRELENERITNTNLNKANNDLNEKFQSLKLRLTGENSPDYLNNIIENKNIEISNLMQTIDHAKKINNNLELNIKEKDNEIKEIINGINVEIKTINQWIDTYLGVYFDQYIEIPELPYTVSKSIKNKIKFDTLKENLIKSQKKMNTELSKCNSFILEMKQENGEQISKYEKVANENSELKNTILKKNEDIYILQQEIENYSSEIGLTKDTLSKLKYEITERNDSFNNYCEKINLIIKNEVDVIKQNSFILNNFSEFLYRASYSENIKDQIKDGLQIIFEIFNTVANEYEKTCNKEINLRNHPIKFDETKLIKELKVNNETLNSQLNEKDELINQMNNEINNLKNMEFNLKSTLRNNDVKSSKDDNLEKLKIFEKKINNLTKELELKDIQIKSQEQMITRRNKELEDLKDEKNRGLRTQQSNKDSHNIDEKINKSMNNSKNNMNISQDMFKNKMIYNYNLQEEDEKSRMSKTKISATNSRYEENK